MSGVCTGEISITALVAGDAVQRVVITADRPLSLASAYNGRPVSVVADAMSALHGLCGQSHAAAVHCAAAAASGTTLRSAELGRWIIRLAGERLAEHLRSLLTAEGAGVPPAEDLAALRDAIAVGSTAARNGIVGSDAVLRLAVTVNEAFPRALGCPGPTLAPTTPPQGVDGGPVRTMTRPACGGSPDVLGPADDEAVVAALAADTDFIRAPHLPGRVPETGPAARHRCSAADTEAAAAARVAEVREAAALLLDPAPGSPEGWITVGPAGPNAGYAAVETPRGRLYYRLVLDDEGKLLDARVVAPTEWNFHPAGPLARALTGFRPGREPLSSITRRAAAFDPCVAMRVFVESASDA